MKNLNLQVTLFLLCCALSTPGRSASSPRSGQRTSISGLVEVIFSTHDERVIQQYVESGPNTLPPGLAKRGGNLPPGLEKHLQRNGTLPPGLQKRLQPFPVELDRQLPRLPRGYARVILEGHAIILGPHNVIVDIFYVRGGEDHEQRWHHGHHGRGHHEDEDRDED